MWEGMKKEGEERSRQGQGQPNSNSDGFGAQALPVTGLQWSMVAGSSRDAARQCILRSNLKPVGPSGRTRSVFCSRDRATEGRGRGPTSEPPPAGPTIFQLKQPNLKSP